MLSLLLTTQPLDAQSWKCWSSGHQQSGKLPELGERISLSAPNITFISSNAATSTLVMVDPTGSGSRSFPDTLCLHPSEVFTSSSVALIGCSDWLTGFPNSGSGQHEADADSKRPSEPSKSAVVSVRTSKPVDFNEFYYKNRFDFSLDGGWLPINIPFVFDVFLGDGYTTTGLNYTLVPIIASIRWQLDDVGGRWIFRGNWDLTASAAFTVIPRGPETRYIAWIMGVRRNFVPHRGRIAPYFDGRLGLGGIDAKEPLGVLYAQGQDFTFTVNMGSGVRYNFNTRYSISAGLNWMHISNLYLSQPKFANYGINVYGPMFGFNVRMGRLHPRSSE